MDRITIVADEPIATINPNIYGHFAEHIGGVIYDGIWVGLDSETPHVDGFRQGIVDAMKRIKAPVVRYPGGCFAETYNWRDGIGPSEERPVTTNWWYRNDGRLESNQVGTAEFVRFCRLIGAEPYLAANITSTTPLEIRNWIDYCNMPARTSSLARLRESHGDSEPFDVTFWGIGNENWGGGGSMTPEDYAGEYRRYATLAANLPGEKMLVACGPAGNDVDWTRRFFEKMSDRLRHPSRLMQGYGAHYYCGTAGSALEFDENQWYQLLWQAAQIERLVVQQRATMDAFDPERRIGLIIDEWGCWHPEGSGPSGGDNLFEQQSTMRDALVAALTLNVFNNHCDKVVMGNIAQLVNNLHSLFLSQGKTLIMTPNFHVFDMYKGHQGSQAVRTLVDTEAVEFENRGRNRKDAIDGISCAASINGNLLMVTAANLRYSEPAEVEITVHGLSTDRATRKATLRGDIPQAHNTFDKPNAAAAVWENGSSADLSAHMMLPAASVTLFEIPL